MKIPAVLFIPDSVNTGSYVEVRDGKEQDTEKFT
jgi:hypothetical protein